MAIDTKAKRASVQAMTLGLMRPPPSGAIGEPQRATVAWFYAGINYDLPSGVVVVLLGAGMFLGLGKFGIRR